MGLVVAFFVALVGAALLVSPQARGHDEELLLATWNLTPTPEACEPWSEDELVALRAPADALDADVVAFQGLGAEADAAQVFDPETYIIEISEQPSDTLASACADTSAEAIPPGRVGFAIRRGLRYSRNPDLEDLGVDGQPWGVDITVHETTPIHVLAVHLRPGCDAPAPSGEPASCATLHRQLPALERWVDFRAGEGVPFVVLGEFSRELTVPGELVWAAIDDGDPVSADLWLATEHWLSECGPEAMPFTSHIVLDKAAAAFHHPRSFEEAVPDEQGPDGRPAGCPISIVLEPPEPDITTGLKWMRESSEYTALTRAIYRRATRRLHEIARARLGQTVPWVVVMDADETLLHNSLRRLEDQVAGEDSDGRRWLSWSRRATAEAVPGSVEFATTVLEVGGKIAVITNRRAGSEDRVRANLEHLGLEIAAAQVCVLGRADEDKEDDNPDEWAEHGYRNDKDRRRRLVAEGQAEACWDGLEDEAKASWNQPHDLVMHFGDKVQDFPEVKQGDDMGDVVERMDEELFLLPNAVSGTWK